MQGLTYGVVRVDTEERLSVLTVQDVGTVTPGGTNQASQSLEKLNLLSFFYYVVYRIIFIFCSTIMYNPLISL